MKLVHFIDVKFINLNIKQHNINKSYILHLLYSWEREREREIEILFSYSYEKITSFFWFIQFQLIKCKVVNFWN